MEEKIIDEFHRKLSYERVKNVNTYENDIRDAYLQILQGISVNYAEYRKHIPQILSSLETNNTNSVSYSINLFFELYNRLIEVKEFKTFDNSIMEFDASEATLDKIMPIIETTLSRKTQQRISDGSFDISSLSANEKTEFASFIIKQIQSDSKEINWSKEKVEGTIMPFIILRQLLVSISKPELFYYVTGIFFDRLTSSEYYQAGRDIAEEVIISSYKDDLPEMGYFNAFKLYSNIGSINASLLYANLSMVCIMKKHHPYSDKYVKEIIWQGMKLFRNVNLMELSIKIYDSVPKELNYSNYERRSLDHTYFTNLLKMQDRLLPSKLLDYFHKEREEILLGGMHDALPWLISLYNIKRIYPSADFSSTGLGFYLSVFESIVPANTVKRYKDIAEGDSSDLKTYLKESLIKLNETRHLTDFVYDNEHAIILSSRLIVSSARNNDASAFLLSMMLKSDYSILFQSKESSEIAPLILPDIDISSIGMLYENKFELMQAFPLTLNCSFICLGFSEGKLYQLQLFNNEFQISFINSWVYQSFKNLINGDFFTNLCFDDCVKDKSGVRSLSPEEFKQEELDLASKLNIAKLNLAEDANAIYIVKDMEISKFPHNLFLNQNGEFIAKSIPVTNVLSTEWFIKSKDFISLNPNYSKSIWIPTESGDIELAYLNSNIEQTLTDFSFNVFNQKELLLPLSSDLNIICSHGAKNISEVQIVFQENLPTYDLDMIIGKGKILIFFVCYSGSMKTEFFRNNVTSLVKRFIANGYDAVIAPFWALDVRIPRYWLPEFLNSIDAGNTISQAMFNANNKVYESYPTPAAWACLHLYGNPNLRVVNK